MPASTLRSSAVDGCQNEGLSSPEVHGDQNVTILTPGLIHELLHTSTGKAHFGDCGAR